MELELQKYLRSPDKSLDTLKVELGVESNTYDNLIIFNYSQIDSPKSHPIVMECRGLVLEKDTWDLISYPFRRFFNDSEVQEITESFCFSDAIALEKLDGSLVSVFNYRGKWLMATRGMIENVSKVGFSDMTFKDLFHETVKKYHGFWNKLNPDFCYIFELTTPENRVVTFYTERDIHLLTMRRVGFWVELALPNLMEQSKILGVSIPSITEFSGKEDLLVLIKKLATLQEGYVAVDYTKMDNDGISFKRVKVKNPSYVAIHHLKDRAGRSLRSLASLVYDNNQEEFLGYFPEFKPYIDTVQKKYDEYIQAMGQDVIDNQKWLDMERTGENRKLFAQVALKCKNPSFMFQLYDGKIKSFAELLNSIEKLKTRKYLEKYLVEQLKLKEQNIYSTEE